MNTQQILASIRATLLSQVRTTKYGQSLSMVDAESLDRLVDNMANNLAMSVENMVTEAVEAVVPAESKADDARLSVAGSGAEGHGVIAGYRGEGPMVRARLVECARAAGLPTEWLPMPKDAGVQLSRAVKACAGSAYNCEQEKKGEMQVVEAREFSTRWMLVTKAIGDGTEAPRAGDKFGNIELVVTLYEDKGRPELVFDTKNLGLETRIREEFTSRLNAELYQAADVTRWLNEVHHGHLQAVRYAFGWYVPRAFRGVAEAIVEAFWTNERWGMAWADPPLPVASSAQLSVGIANGLCMEVDEILADLSHQREVIRGKVAEGKKVRSTDIGKNAAETFMVRLTRVGKRVIAYTELLGQERVEECRMRIHDAMIELDGVLEGGVDEKTFARVWSGAEAETTERHAN